MDTSNVGKRFPFIDLEKAIGRAETLYAADQTGRPMAVQTLYEVWEYSAKSSGGHQTIGALKAYGLIEKDRQGRIGLSANALRYFKDERPDEKGRLLKLFALRPKMFGFLWQHWADAPPADNVARSFLKLDLGMGEQQSRSLLSVYKENLDFAKLKGGDTIVEGENDDDDEENEVNTPSEYGASARNTGAKTQPSTGTPGADRGKSGLGENVYSVQQEGNRLKITANVDAEGLQKLKQLIERYDEILKLMN